MGIREPSLVAEPAAIHVGMVAREDPLDLAFAHRRVDVAADGAETADGRHVLNVPRPCLEAELGRRERADRAELDHVARERRPVRIALERRNLGVGTTVSRHELVVFGNVRRESRAAITENAALAVERDQRRNRDRLFERDLRERHPCPARAIAEREVLQWALAALVAHGAVERVVDEDELERRVLPLGRPLGEGCRLHDHPVLRGERAACLELRQPFDLDEAHPTRAHGRPEPRLVAEDRDLDPGGSGRLDEPCPPRHLDLTVVDHHLHRLGHAGTGARTWTCWATGASNWSREEAPSNGQRPSST